MIRFSDLCLAPRRPDVSARDFFSFISHHRTPFFFVGCSIIAQFILSYLLLQAHRHFILHRSSHGYILIFLFPPSYLCPFPWLLEVARLYLHFVAARSRGRQENGYISKCLQNPNRSHLQPGKDWTKE